MMMMMMMKMKLWKLNLLDDDDKIPCRREIRRERRHFDVIRRLNSHIILYRLALCRSMIQLYTIISHHLNLLYVYIPERATVRNSEYIGIKVCIRAHKSFIALFVPIFILVCIYAWPWYWFHVTCYQSLTLSNALLFFTQLMSMHMALLSWK